MLEFIKAVVNINTVSVQLYLRKLFAHKFHTRRNHNPGRISRQENSIVRVSDKQNYLLRTFSGMLQHSSKTPVTSE